MYIYYAYKVLFPCTFLDNLKFKYNVLVSNKRMVIWICSIDAVCNIIYFFPNVLEIIILPYIVESARTVVRFRAVLESVAVYYVRQR